MSTVQIDVQVKTDKAASDVDKLEQKLSNAKKGAVVPVTIQTQEAEGKITKLMGSLQGLKQNLSSGAAAGGGQALVGVLSQQANELSHGLDGASKSAADFGIAAGVAAASAMGPWGLLAAGIVGVIGLFVRLEREERETEVATARLAEVHNRLSTASTEAAGATTNQANAQERLNAAIIAGRGLLASQANMLGQGFNQTQVDDFRQAIDNVLPAIRASHGALTENVTTQQVLDAVINRNSGQLSQWGINMEFVENQQINVARATALLTNRSIQDAEATRDHAQAAVRAIDAEIAANRRMGLGASQLAQVNTAAYARRAVAATALQTATDNLNRSLELATGNVGANADAALESARTLAGAVDEMTRAAGFKQARNQAMIAAQQNAASAADMRTARRRLMDVNLETANDERVRALRDSTDARIRATQQFRSTVAAETYRREQTTRSIQLARLEEDLQRTRRQTGENEAQRISRLAEAQASYNRIRRESIEAQTVEAQRIRDLADAEKTLEDERREQLRSSALAMLQQREAQRQNAVSLADARRQLAEASLSDDEVASRAVANANIALQNVQAQITANAERLQQARDLGAAQTELNAITQEGAQLQIQLANAQAVQVRASRNQITVTSQLRDVAAETGEAIGKNMMSATMAAIFAGENIGAALQKALSETMQAIATESAVKSLFELAKGIGAFATGNVASGTMHMKSAGLYAATAVVAGGIGAASAPTASPAGGAATSAATRPETPTRRDEEEGRGAPKNISISINAFQSSESAQALIVRSLREAGYNSGRSLPRR